ncbi:MAG: hypothetical protein ACYSXD_02715 [Planctomycetota bacterium]|jgi:hypothetical protein
MINLLLAINLLPLFLVRSFVRPARPIDQNIQKMQNKPNLRNTQMNTNFCLTTPYKNLRPSDDPKTNPNKPNSKPFLTPQRPPEAKINPIQTQSNPISSGPRRPKFTRHSFSEGGQPAELRNSARQKKRQKNMKRTYQIKTKLLNKPNQTQFFSINRNQLFITAFITVTV